MQKAPRAAQPSMSWHSGTAFEPNNGGTILSPQQTSPTGTATPGELDTQRKRKRSSISTPNGDLDSNGSPTTTKGHRHQPGVKRACNDCRQQKVSQSRLPITAEAPVFSHSSHKTTYPC